MLRIYVYLVFNIVFKSWNNFVLILFYSIPTVVCIVGIWSNIHTLFNLAIRGRPFIVWLALAYKLTMIPRWTYQIGYQVYNTLDVIWTWYRIAFRVELYVVLALWHYQTWVVEVMPNKRYMNKMHPLKAKLYVSCTVKNCAFRHINCLVNCLVKYMLHIITLDKTINYVDW